MSHPVSPPKEERLYNCLKYYRTRNNKQAMQMERYESWLPLFLSPSLHFKNYIFSPPDRNRKANKTQKNSSKCPLMLEPIYYVRLCLSNCYWNSSWHFFENLLCAGHSKPPTSICNSETMPPKIERLNDVSVATQVLIVELETYTESSKSKALAFIH